MTLFLITLLIFWIALSVAMAIWRHHLRRPEPRRRTVIRYGDRRVTI